jgi:hypothetical protein
MTLEMMPESSEEEGRRRRGLRDEERETEAGEV